MRRLCSCRRDWRSFKNGARGDKLELYHWVKAGTVPEADYPFAKYNVQTMTYVYSQDEYMRLLEDKDWTKDETDYLFTLVRDFDARWYVVYDRYEYEGGPERSMEDLKDRYYSVCRKLIRNRPWAGDETSKAQLITSLTFDKEREVTRKKYIASLESRTPQQKAEEDALYIELKRLEQGERRFKRDREELLRTLLGIDSGLPDLPVEEDGLNSGTTDTKKKKKGHFSATTEPETPVSASSNAPNVISLGQPQAKKSQSVSSARYDATHCIHRTEAPSTTLTTTKSAHVPVYLRSYKLPQPKAPSAARVAQVLGELGISHTRLVMPTRENCAQLENLLETASALVETKKVVDKVEQDIRIMKARLGQQESGGAETGDAAPTPMDVDDGNDAEGEVDGRAQSVISLVTAMFGAAGTLLGISKRAQNQGKPPRYHIDPWDETMMERDKRLTGHIRGQTSTPAAPEEFATNSEWYTEQTR
ncbi:hypothetical protein EVJ58_g1478 [Rhodofomes roseus]|uniref:SWR1-complex protein 4 n=1 Tax=Rhodofomes roseus TaxID=34475 RepID=A0A4Y9Z195_9APHY|nr:hypothetical protein EVJ58_g1478 [Rhodofomes roseus]